MSGGKMCKKEQKKNCMAREGTDLAFFEASGRNIFTATRRGRPFLTLNGNSKLGRSWGFSISHRCTFHQKKKRKNRHCSKIMSPLTPRHAICHLSPHLPKLSLSQLLLEDEAVAWQLRQWCGVGSRTRGGQGGHRVGVVTADTLETHDVCLSIVGDAGRQRGRNGWGQRWVWRGSRIGRRLFMWEGETLLHVQVQTTSWGQEGETSRADNMRR